MDMHKCSMNIAKEKTYVLIDVMLHVGDEKGVDVYEKTGL